MVRVIHLLLMLVILSPPFIPQAKNLAAADLKLIKTLCHNSDTPEICMKCVMSSKNAEKTNSVGIATILVNCIIDQGNTLGANLTKLASVTSDAKLKPLIQGCARDYGYIAKEHLISAKKYLQKHKYDDAEISVVKARHLDLNCHRDLRRKQRKVPVPSRVFFDMKMYEAFANSACRIIDKLYA